MRLFRYFKDHKVAVFLIIVLLCGQAFCDLALPTFTGDIVDVGIQQSGIQDASTTVMSQRTYRVAEMLADDDEVQLLSSSYELQDDGLYHLTDAGKAQRSALNEVVELPLIIVHYGSQLAGDDGAGYDIDALLAAYDAGMVDKSQVRSAVDEAVESIGASDTLLSQTALSAAKAEYEQDGIDTTQLQFDYLIRTGLTMMGIVALSVLIAATLGFLASRTGAAIGRSLRSRLFSKVVSFSDAEVQRFSAASLITRATNDIQQIQMMCIMILRMVLYSPILAIGGIIMMMSTNVSMTWIIAVAVAVVIIMVLTLMGIAMPKFKIMQKLIDRVNHVAREMLTGVQVVRAFNRQDHMQKRFDDASTTLMRTQLFTNRVMTFMMPLMMLIMNIVSVAIVWVGAGYIDAGTMQTGDMIATITYAMVIIMSFLMLSMLAIIAPRAEVSAQRIEEVLNCELSITDSPDAIEHPFAKEGGATIAFDHVDFRYGDGGELALEDITFTAEAGKTTAIIGSTGSGKSTILKLIERFYDVTDGAVTVDGIDVRDVKQHDLRAQLGYVPQKAFLFSGTIASNIGYAVDDEDEANIERAARVAQADDFIEQKEGRYDAVIAQGGSNVSGGQRQRLAIARALATPSRAYLFDDSFSALDYKTDAALRHALATQMKGKTVLIVAQRIATVLSADKIIVLDDGHVVGQGTHSELMESCDQYREIAFSQLSPSELAGGGAA